MLLHANPVTNVRCFPSDRIVCKKMELADGIEAVVKEHIPRLEHGHDGLIFTCAETGYVVGTDEMM